jgi:hypothetical protein
MSELTPPFPTYFHGLYRNNVTLPSVMVDILLVLRTSRSLKRSSMKTVVADRKFVNNNLNGFVGQKTEIRIFPFEKSQNFALLQVSIPTGKWRSVIRR